MMLSTWTCREFLPAGTEVVEDVELAYALLDKPLRYGERPDVDSFLLTFNGGRLSDKGDRYIDKYGTAIYLSELSTGAKAGILTAVLGEIAPNKCVSTIECGRNVVQAIIEHIDSGNLLIEFDLNRKFEEKYKGKVIRVNGDEAPIGMAQQVLW